jgi:UDP-N-acetylmuramoylalanine--D-glutamate ligase
MLAASAAVRTLCSIESMRMIAESFEGVVHRRELVRELDGVKYYNDSIASSPTRTVASLNSFKQKVILIAGGYDKKIPFEVLAEKGIHKVKLLILVGATANKIEDVFIKEMERTGAKIPIMKGDSLEDAVNIARKQAVPGDIVTLSPACASFDWFKNFEERGNKFKEIVNNLE